MSGIKVDTTLEQDMEKVIQQLKALDAGDSNVDKAELFKGLAAQMGLKLLINAFQELQQQNKKHADEEIKGEIRIKIVRTSDSGTGLTGTLNAFCFPCPIRSDKKICIGIVE